MAKQEMEFDELCQQALRLEQLTIQDKMNMNQTIIHYLQEEPQDEPQRAKNLYDIMIAHTKAYLNNVVNQFESLHDDLERLKFLNDQYKQFMDIVNQMNVMSYPIRKIVKSSWKKPIILKSAKLLFERKFENSSHLIYNHVVNLMQKSINEQNEEKYESYKVLINQVGSLLIELHIENNKILSDAKPSDSKFKKHLLEHFQQLFKEKFISLKEQSVIEYLREVQQLKERLSGLIQFKQEDILQPLQKQLFQELLANYKSILLDEKKEDSFYILIESKNREGLQLVAELFENLDDHYDKMTLAFKTIVLKKGCKILQFYEGKDMDLQTQRQLIDQLSECHTEYQELINTNFKGQKQSSDFLIALNNAFEEILDMKIDNYEIPSFLVNLINDNLEKKEIPKRTKGQRKQSLKQQQPKNDQIKLMKLFMFIGNKERFFELYKNSLSERIIKFSRKGLMTEMISEEEKQLKDIEERCGNQQSESLRIMLQDLQIKIDTEKGFLLNPIILSFQCWPKLPTMEYKLEDKRINDERAKLISLFNTAKKNIQWIDDFSTLEIFDRDTDITYFMTIPQFLILNMFNRDQKLVMNQIQTFTKLDLNVIQQNINILIANDILRLENETYYVNQPPPVKQKKKPKKAQKEVIYLDIVFPERQVTKNFGQLNMDQAVEAQIVRVMKLKKQMKYQDLVDEVKFNMRKFQIDQNLIKQLIERLSKNEYLERDQDDMNLFKYK